jgi:Tfp pilus assembly protein PilO
VKLPARLQWSRLSGRERLILGMVVAVVIGLVGFQLYDHQRKNALKLKSQLEELTNQVAQMSADLPVKEAQLQQAAARQTEVKARAAVEAQTQQQLTAAGGFSQLLTELARMAKDEGIEIVSVKLGDTRDQGTYVELPITIEVRASFRLLGEYLHRLQHLPQLVVVGKVRMETTLETSPLLKAGVETIGFVGKT